LSRNKPQLEVEERLLTVEQFNESDLGSFVTGTRCPVSLSGLRQQRIAKEVHLIARSLRLKPGISHVSLHHGGHVLLRDAARFEIFFRLASFCSQLSKPNRQVDAERAH